MAPIIKVGEHWIVVKTSTLVPDEKAGLIRVGFSYPLLKSGAENTGVLLRKKIAGDTPQTNVAGLIAFYSTPNDGEISPADMAELEALIASLDLDRGGKRKSRKNKSRKSRKNKSRKSRKNKSRK
jgi:hypothetical protein